MKKVIVKIDLYGDKERAKAMEAVSSVPGINSMSMDLNEKKMTVIGEVDTVDIVGKLRKYWFTEVVSVGPPEEPKKEEAKKEDDKKKEDEKKKEEEKKKKKKEEEEKKEKEEIALMVRAAIEIAGCGTPYRTIGYPVQNLGEDYYPNTCAIL